MQKFQIGLSACTFLAISTLCVLQWYHYWSIDICTNRAYNMTLKCLAQQRNQTQCKLLGMQEYYQCTQKEFE
jgi:hypothetical protein